MPRGRPRRYPEGTAYARLKAQREAWAAAGRCRCCGGVPAPGRKRCQHCLCAQRKRTAAYVERTNYKKPMLGRRAPLDRCWRQVDLLARIARLGKARRRVLLDELDWTGIGPALRQLVGRGLITRTRVGNEAIYELTDVAKAAFRQIGREVA